MTPSVLIVDDSMTVRMDLAEAFEAAGFQCQSCASVAEARQALARGPVDVLVLDVLLPDGDGLALLAEVRAAPSGGEVAVLMLSTEAEVKDRIRGLKTGADEYVGKPYEATYVVTKARELLRARRTEAAAGALTVLVIDDSLTFREALRQTLEDAGYGVLTASSGEEGLRVAASQRPSAVVVDGMLPGIDGATVIRRMRLDAALRGVPCLLLTASEDSDAELRALDAGADTFVRKDDDLEVILAKLGALLRRPAIPIEDTESALGPKKILAVDDSGTYLNELAAVLRDEGYDVVQARSGEEALELLAVQSVDCILLDLLMPGLSGKETCRRIKAASPLRDIPLIMLTGLEDRDAMLEGLGAGADDYIQKSSEFDTLKARVRAQIRRKHFEDENRRIRDELLRSEMEIAEARSAREMAETRALHFQELERKNEELQREISERQRAEETLRQVHKLQVVGQLAGGVAHDFNNLLTVVLGNLDRALESAKADKEMTHVLTQALRAAERGAKVTKQLLAFSRKQLLHPELIESSARLNDTVALLTQSIGGKVTLEVDIPADLWAVEIDPSQLEFALLNLCVNARDAMPKGGTLRISASNRTIDENRNGKADYLVIEVADSGTGIPADILPKVFEPYFTTKDVGAGSGLGLSQVHGFAHQSGGFVEIESELGRGTIVTLYLRAAHSPAAAAAPSARDNNDPATIVLVVEDESDVAELAAAVLRGCGFTVKLANRAQVALDFLRGGERVDLIFSDIKMPDGMDGIELAETVRTRFPGIPVLLTTGYADAANNAVSKGLKIIQKPFRQDELLRSIDSILEK
jgi:DNA-binding response OmpR family regulator